MLRKFSYSGLFLARRGPMLAFLFGLGSLAAACSNQTPESRIPFDVGNMALPEPLPQGVVSRTAVSSTALGTGNMAYPAPLPQGTFSTTRIP